jgi:hypothetical protein
MSGNSMKPTNETQPKQPYRSPKLTSYGTLTEMTKTNPSGIGNADMTGISKT